MSDTDDMLNEMNKKLQGISENSYLTRLDLMFSTLLSLTIFLLSITINHPLPKIVSIPLVGLLTIFVITLIGLVHAIIRDDIVGRFKYWIAFLSNFLMFIPYLGMAIMYLSIPVPLFITLAYAVGSELFLALAAYFGIRYFTTFFEGLLKKRLSTKLPEYKKYLSEKGYEGLYVPTVLVYLIMGVSFGIAYLILGG